MIQTGTLNDSFLAKFVRRFSREEFLFHQGDTGNSMYVIVEGTIVLLAKSQKTERLVGTLGAGEVLGEKAILTSAGYKRTFSAQAKTETILLEIDSQNLKLIQAKIPDFTIKILKIISERLDKANNLINILRFTDETERLVQYILYFCKYNFKKTPEGVELALTTDDIHHAVNLEEDFVGKCLEELCRSKILVKRNNGYIVSDENALVQFTGTLKERIAA
jgi:CRP/FNR family cyclic AMP-dependent transcriptional regulator